MVLIGLLLIGVALAAGHLLAEVTGIPAPGPVVGMGMLLIILIVWRPKEDNALMRGADLLLVKMAIFFVPAGVGVIAHVAELGEAPVAVVVGMVLPWFVALAVGGGVAALSLKILTRLSRRGGHPERSGLHRAGR